MTSAARADAIIPVLYLFGGYTFLPSLVLLIIIIIAETLILKLCIKSVGFLRHLAYASLINIISSFAGMVLLPANFWWPFADFYFSSIFVTLGLPFAITVLSEYPAIRFLYKKYVTGKSAWWLDFKINVVSYVLFIILYVPVLFGGIKILSDYLDNRTIKEWSHEEILQDRRGDIYIVSDLDRNDPFDYELKRYTISSKQWDSIKKFESKYFSRRSWDLSDSYFAYESSNPDNTVKIVGRNDFENVSDIPMNCPKTIKISPDEKSIAVLDCIGSVNLRKKNKTVYRKLGSKCKLIIYDINTGENVCDRQVCVFADGLDWSNDSKKLLLVSFENTELLNNDRKETFYEKPHAKIIYVYDIENNSFEKVCEGAGPVWSPDETKIAFVKDDQICVYDCRSEQIKMLCLFKSHYKIETIQWSPSGENLLVIMPTHNPMWNSDFFMGVINVENPELKYIVDVIRHDYGVKWVE